MAMVYMNGSTRAFKWNLSSKKEPSHQVPEAPPDKDVSYTPTAGRNVAETGDRFTARVQDSPLPGIILIRCVMFPSDARRVFTVPFTAHELQSEDPASFLHRKLLKLPFLGSCENLDTCAKTLAIDLAGQFQFSTEFFDQSGRSHALVVYLDLVIEKRVHYSKQWVMKMDNADQIEKYLKMHCPDSATVDSDGMEEVKPAFEIAKVRKNVGCDEDDEVCPICFSELYDESDAEVARTSCSHMFHAVCIARWLLRKGSCPTCRFSFYINV